MRCDTIKATKWPIEITEFVLSPENSRAVPGEASVSVRYGVRKPKYILLKSRHELATTFKAIHPDCKFSASAIMREFPQNAVTATTRDLERNSCPYHTNARRLIKCIHKAGVGKDIKASCRALCGWIIVLAGHERMIAIAVPHKVKIWFTKKNVIFIASFWN